jgi:hypothetical protein
MFGRLNKILAPPKKHFQTTVDNVLSFYMNSEAGLRTFVCYIYKFQCLTTDQLKLCGITSQEDAMQLRDQGRDGRSKFNGVGMFQKWA